MSNYKRNECNKNNKNSGIYCIINKINNKKYVGQTYNIYYRWKRHKSDLNCNNHSNAHLQNAWNKYGKDNFEFKIIEFCDLDIIDEREIYWINYYDSIKNGYNLCEGGLGCRGYKHTEEELTKMRQVQSPKKVLQLDMNGNLIKEWDSASQASKVLNCYRLAITNCCERKDYVKSVKGYIFIYSEEKDNIDMNYYFKEKVYNTKKINQYSKDMEYIKTWDSIQEIIDTYGWSRASIGNNIHGRTKTSHGFIWREVV